MFYFCYTLDVEHKGVEHKLLYFVTSINYYIRYVHTLYGWSLTSVHKPVLTIEYQAKELIQKVMRFQELKIQQQYYS